LSSVAPLAQLAETGHDILWRRGRSELWSVCGSAREGELGWTRRSNNSDPNRQRKRDRETKRQTAGQLDIRPKTLWSFWSCLALDLALSGYFVVWCRPSPFCHALAAVMCSLLRLFTTFAHFEPHPPMLLSAGLAASQAKPKLIKKEENKRPKTGLRRNRPNTT